MSTQLKEPTGHSRQRPLLAWIDASASVLIGLGLGCWIWLLQNRDRLPSPEVMAGKTLLWQYQATSHDVFLALLALSVLTLLVIIRRAQHEQRQQQPAQQQTTTGNPLLRFARAHPLVLALFAGYTVAMVHGTNWMYPELVGWYSDVSGEHLLNNFSFRQGFVSETMRRDDFRFFPLSHQDLHLLSWFTPYPKIWTLISAAELVATIGLSVAVVQQSLRATNPQAAKTPALLLISCVGAAAVLSYAVLAQQLAGAGTTEFLFDWASAGAFTLEMGFRVDALGAVMLSLVTTIAVLVMIYSDGYMAHDKGYVRFFTYLALFSSSMLGLVISPNLLQIYVF